MFLNRNSESFVEERYNEKRLDEKKPKTKKDRVRGSRSYRASYSLLYQVKFLHSLRVISGQCMQHKPSPCAASLIDQALRCYRYWCCSFWASSIQTVPVPWRKILNSAACDIRYSAFRTHSTQSDRTAPYQIDRAQLEAAKLQGFRYIRFGGPGLLGLERLFM